MNRLRRSMALALSARNFTPRKDSGISAGMMTALKMTAERIAERGESRRITLSRSSAGKTAENIAGMIAKYFATSLAIENVVSAPRVMSSCLPISTISMSFVGLESRSTMLPASRAAWVPVFMATPTSACASAGASLVPSPVIATSRLPPCSFRISVILSSGVASARKSSTPASSAIARAVTGLSPVIMTVRMPIRRSSSNRSRIPCLTMSFRWMPPSARASSPSKCSATTSGVPPVPLMPSTAGPTSLVGRPPLSRIHFITAAAAPLRMRRTRPSSLMSTPLIRLSAENGTKCACGIRPSSRARRPNSFLASTTIERPSGVSSARLDSWAASASCPLVTPSTGRSSAASRLPRVIVPVLSSSSVFTSPAASTARPETASTLCCTSRSIPAMPMADSNAPIVVGMRQTSSATSTTIFCSAWEYMAKGCNVTTDSSRITVRPTRRMLSAISFGVFCRDAPSTRAIIRSRKVSPGRAVMRTTIRSDSTLVPPVTADRSPPASRITGADSPVIADSSTEAMPSMISPSEGMISPAETTTMSSTSSCEDGTCSRSPPAVRRLASVSDRVRRSVAACAFPRPSAIASAKLANSTVNHRNAATSAVKTFSSAVERAMSRKNRTVLRKLPTSTTNMTGLRTWTRGWSLRKLSTIAPPTIAGSNSDRLASRSCPMGARSVVGAGGETVPMPSVLLQRQLLDDGAQGERRDAQHDPADQHAQPDRGVVPRRGGGDPGEGGAVVVRAGREGVQDLRQAVRARVVPRGERALHQHRRRGEGQQHRGHGQDVEHDQLHLGRLDLLAEVLRSSTDHEPGEEHRQDHEDQQAVEPHADTARAHLAQHDVADRDHPAQRREAVVHGVDRPVRRTSGGRGPQPGRGRPEADLLALHPAARMGRGVGLGHAQGVHARVAVRLEEHGRQRHAEPDHGHDGEDRPPLPAIANHPSEREGQGERDDQDAPGLDEVVERRGVLERVRRVHVEEPAAVGAQLLDGDLARRRAAGDQLGRTLQCGHRGVTVEVLDHALAHEPEREQERHRQQDPHHGSGEVDPEVAERRGAPAGQPGSAPPSPPCRQRPTRSSAR